MKVLLDRDVWDLVAKPENAKVISNRWVFSTKRDSEGHVMRHKSRLVARGFLQTRGESFDDTFSPVVNSH